MRAAVLTAYGVPTFGTFPDPEPTDGFATLTVKAAGLNPIDLAIAAGKIAARMPQLPSVAGSEGVGLMDDGARVYFNGCKAPYGAMAERTLVAPARTLPVPDGISDGVAVALGIAGLTAWLSLSWRARLVPGEHVLILGASGAVGLLAVQAARLLGAGRVIAAARSAEGLERARAAGAHATVVLEGSESDIADAIRAQSGNRLDVIIDPLWGVPAAAALQVASAGARLVQLGSSAGGQMPFNPAFMRGPQISLLGFSSGTVPQPEKAAAYAAMCAAVLRGDMAIPVESLPLAKVADAWQRQADFPHHKLVLEP